MLDIQIKFLSNKNNRNRHLVKYKTNLKNINSHIYSKNLINGEDCWMKKDDEV